MFLDMNTRTKAKERDIVTARDGDRDRDRDGNREGDREGDSEWDSDGDRDSERDRDRDREWHLVRDKSAYILYLDKT
jgi:hypothetical protein